MSEDDRPTNKPPPPLRDARRQTGRERPHVVEVHVPAPIQPRHDDDAFRRRVLSEVDVRLRGMAEGLAHHVRELVHAELAPYIDKLSRIDHVVTMLEEDRDERAMYRAEREAREKIDRERNEEDMRRLQLQRGQVEIQRMSVELQQLPTEAARKYKLALFGVIAGALATIAGLIGAAIGSRRGP